MRPGLALAWLAFLFLPAAGAEEPWTWSGVEILGNHGVGRAEIERLVPIPLGEAYRVGDPPFWVENCEAVREKLGFVAVLCGERPLRVFDGRKAYLIVDVVEKGNEALLHFRKAPSGSVPFASDEMLRLSEELAGKTLAAAMAGHAYRESGAPGYLTYEDPEGHNEDVGPLVARLARLVPRYRKNLFDVLRREQDAGRRQQAANLLNWAGGDLERLIGDTLPLLEDPDGGVRNNLSRFMIAFVDRVGSRRLRHKLVDAFVLQIRRPSHGDRNKGLYNLLAIAKARPDDREYILRVGGDALRYLAANSIVFNVRDPAKELLELTSSSTSPSAR